MTEPLITADQAAELLGVPASWIYDQARKDAIPYVELGRYRRFQATALEEWWQTRRRGPWRSNSTIANTNSTTS